MLWHLMVDFGLGSPLHFVASREAAVAFAREAIDKGWARAAAVDDRVDQSYPTMPCQFLHAPASATNPARTF